MTRWFRRLLIAAAIRREIAKGARYRWKRMREREAEQDAHEDPTVEWMPLHEAPSDVQEVFAHLLRSALGAPLDPAKAAAHLRANMPPLDPGRQRIEVRGWSRPFPAHARSAPWVRTWA